MQGVKLAELISHPIRTFNHQNIPLAEHQWLTPVIISTQAAEIRRIMV
jgi:hypothetical protein